MMAEVSDEEFTPSSRRPSAAPPPNAAIRRSQAGPDDRWPPIPGRRWYVYDGDRPLGYLDRFDLRHRSSWAPYTLTGGRLAGPWPLNDALAYLVRYDVTGWSPMRVCDVCGARLRTRRNDPAVHLPTCPLLLHDLFG